MWIQESNNNARQDNDPVLEEQDWETNTPFVMRLPVNTSRRILNTGKWQMKKNWSTTKESKKSVVDSNINCHCRGTCSRVQKQETPPRQQVHNWTQVEQQLGVYKIPTTRVKKWLQNWMDHTVLWTYYWAVNGKEGYNCPCNQSLIVVTVANTYLCERNHCHIRCKDKRGQLSHQPWNISIICAHAIRLHLLSFAASFARVLPSHLRLLGEVSDQCCCRPATEVPGTYAHTKCIGRLFSWGHKENGEQGLPTIAVGKATRQPQRSLSSKTWMPRSPSRGRGCGGLHSGRGCRWGRVHGQTGSVADNRGYGRALDIELH